MKQPHPRVNTVPGRYIIRISLSLSLILSLLISVNICLINYVQLCNTQYKNNTKLNGKMCNESISEWGWSGSPCASPPSCGPMRGAINVTPTLHRNQAQVLPHSSWSCGSRLLVVVLDAGVCLKGKKHSSGSAGCTDDECYLMPFL